MSDNENTVLLEVYRTVGKMESAIQAMDKKIDTGFENMNEKVDSGFNAVNKRVDTVEQKMTDRKADFRKGYLYPVMVFFSTTALIGLLALIVKLFVFMDTVARGSIKP